MYLHFIFFVLLFEYHLRTNPTTLSRAHLICLMISHNSKEILTKKLKNNRHILYSHMVLDIPPLEGYG